MKTFLILQAKDYKFMVQYSMETAYPIGQPHTPTLCVCLYRATPYPNPPLQNVDGHLLDNGFSMVSS